MTYLGNELGGEEVDAQRNFWFRHIDAYERKASGWEKKSKKIIKRFLMEKDAGKRASQYNILWSNVQTLLPALYDRAPTPNIERRFNKTDKVGKEASILLERSVTYFVDTDDFSDKVRQAVLDRLLPGRGTVWVRYEPTIEQAFNSEQTDGQVSDDVLEQVKYEDVSFDYVHWKDFGHTLGRTWQEVRAVWRRVCMDKEALVKRFGEEIAKAMPMDSKAEDADKESENDRAEIYELWDKQTKRVFWLSRSYAKVLDEQEDPLRLKDFFPCPKPMLATVANDGLIPTPDYEIYYDQARELDILTGRIDLLLNAVKVAGVYDASVEGLPRLLSEAAENKLIPVSNWAMFGDKGGLKGVVDFMPLDQIIQTIQALYDARERLKQDLYEITGMSDIIRGASNPSETATAQQIKGQYASMRLGDMQKDVARFCRDLVRITAEIIANLFSPDTIKQISSSDLMTAQEKQMAMMQAQATGQAPNNAAMEKPDLESVMALLRNDMARCFRIAIETDSTIKVDQEADKAARNEFLAAAGGFIQQAAQVPVPELQPLLMDMLLFGMRGFKAGRELENSFERVQAELEEKRKQPPPPPQPDMKLQLEAQKVQQDAQLKSQELELKRQEMQQNMQLEAVKMRLDAKSKVAPEVAMTDAELNGGQSPLLSLLAQMQANAVQQSEAMTAAMQSIAQMQVAGSQAVVGAVTAPKRVVRDQQGKIIGVEAVSG